MSYRIMGLSSEPFRPLYGLSDAALAARGVTRVIADQKPGFPDRIELRDAEPGQSLLLLNYTHQPARNAYHASHAIFVLEGAETSYDRIDEIPPVMHARPMSLRAFDAHDVMIEAELSAGQELESAIQRLLGRATVDYIQAHYAKRGCYAARITRAG
jgi:Protein of unknown function (DUF1203)